MLFPSGCAENYKRNAVAVKIFSVANRAAVAPPSIGAGKNDGIDVLGKLLFEFLG